MSKPVKEMVVAELRKTFEGVQNACVVDLTGLNIQEQEEIRCALREKSARLQVVKNNLTRRALKDTPLEPLAAALEGPCALVTGSESLIEAAKVLVEAGKEFSAFKLKHAMVDGEPELITVEEVSKMKGRHELLGEIAMLIVSPGRALAGSIGSPAFRPPVP